MTTIKMLKWAMTGDQIELHGLSDMHIGSQEFSERAFGEWRRMILDEPYRYVAVAGDIIDNGIKSSVTSPYEAVMQPRAQRKYAEELLEPIKHRILCWTSGNHEYRS